MKSPISEAVRELEFLLAGGINSNNVVYTEELVRKHLASGHSVFVNAAAQLGITDQSQSQPVAL